MLKNLIVIILAFGIYGLVLSSCGDSQRRPLKMPPDTAAFREVHLRMTVPEFAASIKDTLPEIGGDYFTLKVYFQPTVKQLVELRLVSTEYPVGALKGKIKTDLDSLAEHFIGLYGLPVYTTAKMEPDEFNWPFETRIHCYWDLKTKFIEIGVQRMADRSNGFYYIPPDQVKTFTAYCKIYDKALNNVIPDEILQEKIKRAKEKAGIK